MSQVLDHAKNNPRSWQAALKRAAKKACEQEIPCDLAFLDTKGALERKNASESPDDPYLVVQDFVESPSVARQTLDGTPVVIDLSSEGSPQIAPVSQIAPVQDGPQIAPVHFPQEALELFLVKLPQ